MEPSYVIELWDVLQSRRNGWEEALYDLAEVIRRSIGADRVAGAVLDLEDGGGNARLAVRTVDQDRRPMCLLGAGYAPSFQQELVGWVTDFGKMGSDPFVKNVLGRIRQSHAATTWDGDFGSEPPRQWNGAWALDRTKITAIAGLGIRLPLIQAGRKSGSVMVGFSLHKVVTEPAIGFDRRINDWQILFDGLVTRELPKTLNLLRASKPLTDQEWAVAEMMQRGVSNQQMAGILGCSVTSIENTKKRVREKLAL